MDDTQQEGGGTERPTVVEEGDPGTTGGRRTEMDNRPIEVGVDDLRPLPRGAPKVTQRSKNRGAEAEFVPASPSFDRHTEETDIATIAAPSADPEADTQETPILERSDPRSGTNPSLRPPPPEQKLVTILPQGMPPVEYGPPAEYIRDEEPDTNDGGGQSNLGAFVAAAAVVLMPLAPRKVFQYGERDSSYRELPALSLSSIDDRTQLPAAVKGSSSWEA